MPAQPFHRRPDTVQMWFQWDGTNIAEIESVYPQATVTDNGDGTVTVTAGGLLGYSFTAALTDWLGLNGGHMTAVEHQVTYQPVVGNPPYSYDITGS